MKTYDKYKPSGIDWIGDIPEHWNTVSLKWVSKIYSGGTPDTNRSEYWTDGNIPWLNSGVVNQFKVTKPSDYITEEGFNNSSAKWIDENSLVIALAGQGKTKGMSALVTFKTTGNQSLGVIKPNEKYESRFLLYFLTRNYSYIRGLAGEGIRDGLNLGVIGNLSIPIFDKYEQTAIADYLDEKTAQIDSLVENKLRLIELLKEERTAIINRAVTRGINENAKLKPSGISWLDDIPEHWEAKKLKYFVEIYGRIGFRGYTNDDIVQEGQGAISLSPSNIKDNKLLLEQKTYVNWGKYYESPEIQIFEDDVIFVKTGSTIGKIAIVPKCDVSLTLNPQMVVFKNLKIYNKYLFYFFLNPVIKFQLDTQMIGGAAQTISQEKLNSMTIIQPPLEEQKQIVEFIENATSKIDATIATIEKEIGFLGEYRTALISEVITGKIKVV